MAVTETNTSSEDNAGVRLPAPRPVLITKAREPFGCAIVRDSIEAAFGPKPVCGYGRAVSDAIVRPHGAGPDRGTGARCAAPTR